MAEPLKKKSRSTNFTNNDEARLISLCKKYSSVVECKKTDKLTWRQKNEAWEKLANEFNAGCTSGPRTAASLLLKYKNIKKDFRQEAGKERQSIYATGGGPQKETKPHRLQHELAELLSLSAEGLNNPFDNDSLTLKTVRAGSDKQGRESDESEIDGEVEEWENVNLDILDNVNMEETNIDGTSDPDVLLKDWSSYNPGMLRQRKNPALTGKRGTHAPLVSLPSTSWAPVIAEECIGPDSEPNDPAGPSAKKLPGVANQNMFKMNHNRPGLTKFKALKPASAANAKYSALADANKSLADAQLQLVQNELKMKENLYKKKMMLLDLKIDVQNLEKAILEKKLAQ